MSLFSWLLPLYHWILDTFRYSIWASSPTSIEYLELAASQSTTYEEWLTCQTELDAVLQKHIWFSKDSDPSYDSSALRGHKIAVEECRERSDNRSLAGLLRSHSSRNLCRILSASLYRQSHVRTKNLIHSYMNEIKFAIRHLARRESMIASPNVVSAQDKRQLFNDVKQALGRTTLVLQGGAAFSLCHLGVVKALYAQGLLPQIITGTAIGALIGALVCTTPAYELERRLKGDSIDLSAFERARVHKNRTRESSTKIANWTDTLFRRLKRLYDTGHLFDIAVLQECARDNLGDFTFEEAFAKTGRVLNITVALPDVPGMPQLLNYITAPHVYIWSAVVASIATSKMMYGPVNVYCRSESGERIRFFASDATLKVPRHQSIPSEHPLKRIGELFNVNHFIVSQTRPYIIPFILWQQQRPGLLGTIFYKSAILIFGLLLHFIQTLSHMGKAPAAIRRILVDEAIPTGSPWSKITIIPDLHFHDLARVFETPTAASIDEWILYGERSVWPYICELKIRCGVEFDLDAAHESVRRRTPGQSYVRPA